MSDGRVRAIPDRGPDRGPDRSGAGFPRAAPPWGLAAAGIAFLSVMDGVVKELAPLLPVLQLTFLRFVATALIIGPFVLRRVPMPGRAAMRGYLLRGVMIAASSLGFFYGLGRLPLAEVFALSYLAPILVALLAPAMLGERPSAAVLAALGLGFAGVLLTVVGGLDLRAPAPERLAGAAAVLASALAYALAVVLLRRQARTEPAALIVLFQSVVPALLLAVPAGLAWAPVDLRSAGLLAVIGALGVAGQLALAHAFARGEASRLVALEYTGFVWAALIGLAVFGEVPAPATLAGAALVVAGCLLVRR